MLEVIHVEMYLFDTCTHKCGYCTLAESGLVLDAAQLQRFRSPEFIGKVTSFFNNRTSTTRKFNLILTGGEPLLMPNFDLFCSNIFMTGNTISIYSALLLSLDHPSFQAILQAEPGSFKYIMASLHPESETVHENFFSKVKLIKERGHSIVVRFVGHPKRLSVLDKYHAACKKIGVTFYPTTLFSSKYPAEYTDNERRQLSKYFTCNSQWIQMKNGIKTETTKCWAGTRLIAVNLKTGLITPCIDVDRPIIGNIFEDRLNLSHGIQQCAQPGTCCLCDVQFQQDIVVGAEDSLAFDQACKQYVEPIDSDKQLGQLEAMGREVSVCQPRIGQTKSQDVLAFTNAQVQQAWKETKKQRNDNGGHHEKRPKSLLRRMKRAVKEVRKKLFGSSARP